MKITDYTAFPADIPIVVEDNLFLYPFMISPLFLADEENIRAANEALEHNSLVMVCTAKVGGEQGRDFNAIYPAGVIGSIMRKVELPDGRVKILFQGMQKGKILKELGSMPLRATIDLIQTHRSEAMKVEAALSVLREKITQLSSLSGQFPPDLLKTVEENSDVNRIIDLIASTMKLKKEQAYKLFVEADDEVRLLQIIDYVIEEIESSRLKKEIKTKVHSQIEKVNKEYFLKEQLKQIQKELGTDNQREEEIEEYRKKLEAKKEYMEEDAYKEIKKQIDKLARMHPDSADANLIQSYLDWVIEIPFG